jgi:hypothetical protein
MDGGSLGRGGCESVADGGQCGAADEAATVYHVIAPTRGKCVPTDFLAGATSWRLVRSIVAMLI